MTNHLAGEKSPYLRQHDDNPVDWYPWGEEAFKRAKELDRPIFLSIGYSTCHWCHVMAHESFEDEKVAARMNEVFIPVKVDREERPDIDSVYMKAAVASTGRGGWPLSVIMTPDGKPFFCGTYIPKRPRYGMVGLLDLIDRIEHLWRGSRNELTDISEQIIENINDERTGEVDLNGSLLSTAVGDLQRTYDGVHGGFKGPPKFPSPHQLLFLFNRYGITRDRGALEMAVGTLTGMALGGIHDHVGGGFHRYSTDEKWLVPHFEKMLYDQAMLLSAYTEGYLVTGKELFRRTALDIVEYVMGQMRSGDGLFYSAEDADSEGVEGKFYVWKYDEIIEVLGKKDGERFCSLFNIGRKGNYRVESTGDRDGKNISYLSSDPFEGVPPEWFERSLRTLRNKRDKRIRPSRDEKVLTDWNSLMISSLARAGRVFNDNSLTEEAVGSMRALRGVMMDDEGKLFHRYMEGEMSVDGMLDDHAFMALAHLDLYEATFDVCWLEGALELLEIMVAKFYDDKGGFFQTAHGSERLITRTKEGYDGALPSGNSIAALALVLAARMTGRYELEERAKGVFSFFSENMTRYPAGYAMMLLAFSHHVGPSKEIVISGERGDEKTREMLDVIRSSFVPNSVLVLREGGKKAERLGAVAPYTLDSVPIGGVPTAYVCKGLNCDVPIRDPSVLAESLRDV